MLLRHKYIHMRVGISSGLRDNAAIKEICLVHRTMLFMTSLVSTIKLHTIKRYQEKGCK